MRKRQHRFHSRSRALSDSRIGIFDHERQLKKRPISLRGVLQESEWHHVRQIHIYGFGSAHHMVYRRHASKRCSGSINMASCTAKSHT
jgi:hypothetical protein